MPFSDIKKAFGLYILTAFLIVLIDENTVVLKYKKMEI